MMLPTLFDALEPTGEDLRDAGMAEVLTNEPEAFRASFELAVELLAGTGEAFTVEDVRRFTGDPWNHHVMGALMNAAAKRGVVEFVGYVRPERPSLHAHRIASWRGA